METSCWKTYRQVNTNTETNWWFLFWWKFRQTSENAAIGWNRLWQKQSADEKDRKSIACKKNQTDWLQKPQFYWLCYDNANKKLMTCSICIQQKKINAMTRGTESFRIIYTSNHFNNRVLTRVWIPRVTDSWAQIFKSQNEIYKSQRALIKGQKYFIIMERYG